MNQITKSKFFKESKNNNHLDLYYGKEQGLTLTQLELKKLLKEFTILCQEKNIKPILMHGSLIGWYFNGKMLPWDNDIDIVLVGGSIDKLKQLDKFENDNLIIKVNSNSNYRGHDDRHNVIDARVISKNNGVFIDITFFYQSLDDFFKKNISRYLKTIYTTTNPYMKANYLIKLKTICRSFNISETPENTNYVNCKSPHYYNVKHIFPLIKDKFEDCDVYLPNNIKECLNQEYGNDVFKPRYNRWKFNVQRNTWLKS